MIYTIGYQQLAQPRLVEIVSHLGAVLIDVRSSPRSRKASFGGRQLAEALGAVYEAAPHLGGRGEIADQAIAALASSAVRGRPLLLMCQEHAPAECHRHYEIALRLLPFGVDCQHICADEIVVASELQRSLDSGDGYEYEDLGF